MDEATIKQIASSIASHLPDPSIGLFVAQTVLFAIVARVGLSSASSGHLRSKEAGRLSLAPADRIDTALAP
jgi:hypothetical protein